MVICGYIGLRAVVTQFLLGLRGHTTELSVQVYLGSHYPEPTSIGVERIERLGFKEFILIQKGVYQDIWGGVLAFRARNLGSRS